ncbi:MAG: hypothetical protein A2W90_03830 [Bacteroidetes bacterium GWF2_42_66]|nr:MAG: hypothetical protein A2W92_18750 [Bacteroidetes bacterium GWA2_42_15]OFY02544.1 MAG: hypothetical protein A2W89_22020 [Bacteroidetes bacterium GWE2_42_39]OFY41357.1 MAG: hypothetical protein A2W90_03830 [Bacteroidetes bacterium GWF2_42_66]HBL75442.1 hypothetical protein [Prolixibacteraceae bacterium]HCR91455.1 hypothetical protein [Prolixibacteraceae bacterium]
MKQLIIALFLIAVAGCKTPQMYVAPELKNDSQLLPVKGRLGFHIKRSLSFGEYSTSKVKQGWVKGYDIPFFVRFQGMKEKLSFQQFGKPGQVAEVYSVGKFRSTELPVLKDHFNIILKEKNHFAGTVIMNEGQDVWEFLLYNPDGEAFRSRKAGFAQKNNEVIEIKGVNNLEYGNNLSSKFLGYEFIYNRQTVGAVEIIDNGKIWLKTDLHDDLKLVVASLSSSLLLRTSLEEKIE